MNGNEWKIIVSSVSSGACPVASCSHRGGVLEGLLQLGLAQEHVAARHAPEHALEGGHALPGDDSGDEPVPRRAQSGALVGGHWLAGRGGEERLGARPYQLRHRLGDQHYRSQKN